MSDQNPNQSDILSYQPKIYNSSTDINVSLPIAVNYILHRVKLTSLFHSLQMLMNTKYLKNLVMMLMRIQIIVWKGRKTLQLMMK